MLTIIQVGHNEASDRYIRNKVRAIAKEGLETEVINLPEDCSTVDVIKAIRQVKEADASAIMVQLPLPPQIDKEEVMAHIPLEKDIDGLNPWSVFKPLTPCAIMRWFTENGIGLEGKMVTVLGRSELVGKPLAEMMIDAGATVAVCNSHTLSHTEELLCGISDIIISAVGQPNTITSAHLGQFISQTVIDVGINTDEDGKLCGDVSEAARKKIENQEGYCSPVPRGVGKWTVRELIIRLKEMERNND